MLIEPHSRHEFFVATARAAAQDASGDAALSGVSGFATALPLASRASAAASPALDPSIGTIV
jgi:hypothetical protein